MRATALRLRVRRQQGKRPCGWRRQNSRSVGDGPGGSWRPGRWRRRAWSRRASRPGWRRHRVPACGNPNGGCDRLRGQWSRFHRRVRCGGPSRGRRRWWLRWCRGRRRGNAGWRRRYLRPRCGCRTRRVFHEKTSEGRPANHWRRSTAWIAWLIRAPPPSRAKVPCQLSESVRRRSAAVPHRRWRG